MSGFGILVAGFLSLVLWFQVSGAPTFYVCPIDELDSPDGFIVAKEEALTSGELAAFVISALVETLLFVGSILGCDAQQLQFAKYSRATRFVGAIVRKQSFLQIYAWFLYVHVFLNVGVAIYLFVVLTNFHNNAVRVACDNTITDAEAQDQCRGLLSVAGKVFIAVTAIVLVAEICTSTISDSSNNGLTRAQTVPSSQRGTSTSSSARSAINETGSAQTTVPSAWSPSTAVSATDRDQRRFTCR